MGCQYHDLRVITCSLFCHLPVLLPRPPPSCNTHTPLVHFKSLSNNVTNSSFQFQISNPPQHRSPDDAWIAVRGRVYNLTSYLPYHPGGAKILMAHAGKDATMAFNRYHAWVNVDALLGRAFVGVLEVEEAGVFWVEAGGS